MLFSPTIPRHESTKATNDLGDSPTLAYNESTTLLTSSSVSIPAPYVSYHDDISKRVELGQSDDIRQFQSRRIPVNIHVLGLIRRGKPCLKSSERVYPGSQQSAHVK